MTTYTKLLVYSFLLCLVSSTKVKHKSTTSHYNLHSQEALPHTKENHSKNYNSERRAGTDASPDHDGKSHNRYKATTNASSASGSGLLVLQATDNEFSFRPYNSHGSLLENNAKQANFSKADIGDFYAEAQEVAINAHVGLKRRAKSTMDNLGKAVDGQLREIGHQINLYVEGVENKIVEEQTKNNEALEQVKTKLGAELETLEKKLKDQEDRVRESKIYLLKQRLKEVTAKLEEANKELSQVANKYLASRFLCKGYTECSQCTKDANCGWCLSEGRCVEGNKKSSLNEYCAIYDYDICSGSGCSSLKDCDDESCGWCASSVGSSRGECAEKFANYTGCPSQRWFHSQGVKNECEVDETAQPVISQEEEGVEPEQSNEEEEGEGSSVDIQALDAQLGELQKKSASIRDEIDEIRDESKFLTLDRYQDELGNNNTEDTETVEAAAAAANNTSQSEVTQTES